MTDMLFDLPESLSPKLAWLKQHGLVTSFDRTMDGKSESPETGELCLPWLCAPDGPVEEPFYGAGMTEEESIIDYCEKIGIKHYSLP